MQTAYIFSPNNSQAMTIARLLHRYYPEATIIGVPLADEPKTSLPPLYQAIIPAAQFDFGSANGVLIPTGAKSTRLLLEQGSVSLGAVKLTQSALQVYEKPWIIAAALRAGIPTPATWEKLPETAQYPMFYKQRYEQGGGTRGIAYSPADIPAASMDNLIFQEVVASQGTYGVGFLAERGKILASYAHFERESVPPAGGSAVILECMADSRPLQYTRQLIKFINYSGWGLAEFKRHPELDEFLFMEINAKFWASCEFAFRNAPAFLKLLFNIDSREKPAQRLIFVDRALTRGLLFTLSHIRYFASSELCIYPGWARRAVASRIPAGIRRRF
jgi:hypothetical protein